MCMRARESLESGNAADVSERKSAQDTPFAKRHVRMLAFPWDPELTGHTGESSFSGNQPVCW